MRNFKSIVGLLVLGSSLSLHAQQHDHSADDQSVSAQSGHDHSAAEQQGGQAQQRFSQLDTNGDGVINFEEFSAMPMTGFNRQDTNGDGVISRDELLERRFLQLDTNNDGLVSAEEFAAGQRANGQMQQRRQRGQGARMRQGQGQEGQGQRGMQEMTSEMTPEQRAQMRERMQQMSPEQRQQMREQMQQGTQRPMLRSQGNQSPL
jgi:Ca2+-binding EF-hand superfamily protein